MSVIVLLVAAGAMVAAAFLAAFVWAVRSGQFDDTATPPLRMLLDLPGRRGAPALSSRSDRLSRSDKDSPHA